MRLNNKKKLFQFYEYILKITLLPNFSFQQEQLQSGYYGW